ncbi:SRPBCC family protein, partial [Algibacter sp.]|nr:SRPBCC family protein [Algibacter sp.]
PESWAVIQDEEKMSEWLPGFQKIEHLSGTPGTIGGVSLVYFNNDGQQMSIRETITDIVPEKSISMTFEDDFMNMDYIIYLISIDGKTKIKSSTTAVGNSTISKSIMALMGGSIKAQEEANLVNLKKAIEQNTKDYFHAGEEIIKNEE